MSRGRRRRLQIIGAVSILPAIVGAFVAWRAANGNFAVVTKGAVYRSAQLDASTLRRTIDRYDIKTVLNLRGPNPSSAWYRDEVAATLRSGASQVDIPLASDQYLSRHQARVLLETLETCERPVLIHCQFGAERTGLACALLTLLEPGSTVKQARRQFSPYYLFLPVQDGAVMLGHLRAYQEWLAARGFQHAPARVRRWLAAEYQPGSPSREEWPYDPYPLRLVTGPAALAR